MKTLFFIGLLILTSFSWAQEDIINAEIETVCRNWEATLAEKSTPEYQQLKKARKKKVFGVYSRVLFAKNTIVGAQALPDSADGNGRIRKDIKIYSTNLSDKYAGDALAFKSELKQYKIQRKNLRKLRKNFSKLFEKTSNYAECSMVLNKNRSYIGVVREATLKFQEISQIGKEFDNKRIFKITSKVSRLYTRSEMVGATLDELSNDLQLQKESIAVLVLHASEDGRLYDSNWNYVPLSILSEISPNIKTLLIYACYASAVAERYKLKDLAMKKNIKVILPEIHDKIEWLLKENAPAPLFKFFMRKALRKSIFSFEKIEVTLSKQCTIEMAANSLQDGSLGLFLNQKYVGMIVPGNNSIHYDCQINSDKNTITLQNMNLLKTPVFDSSIESWAIQMNQSKSEIKHTFKNNKYVGSKVSIRL